MLTPGRMLEARAWVLGGWVLGAAPPAAAARTPGARGSRTRAVWARAREVRVTGTQREWGLQAWVAAGRAQVAVVGERLGAGARRVEARPIRRAAVPATKGWARRRVVLVWARVVREERPADGSLLVACQMRLAEVRSLKATEGAAMGAVVAASRPLAHWVWEHPGYLLCSLEPG